MALHELAMSIMLESKQDRLVSSLETAIFLLQCVLAQQPPGHASRLDTLQYLSRGLLARFMQGGHFGDVTAVVLLLGESAGQLSLKGADFEV
jgi:hypothetical protein